MITIVRNFNKFSYNFGVNKNQFQGKYKMLYSYNKLHSSKKIRKINRNVT